jgi:hypothetical protein
LALKTIRTNEILPFGEKILKTTKTKDNHSKKQKTLGKNQTQNNKISKEWLGRRHCLQIFVVFCVFGVT